MPRLLNRSRVKVAILDSGIDLDHPWFSKKGQFCQEMPRERVKGYCSFLLGPIDDKGGNQEGINLAEDIIGHGTHVASLVLRLAPNAFVYVARVIDDKSKVDPRVVANVCSPEDRSERFND